VTSQAPASTRFAAAAGLKTGSIYFHFESKDRLVEAMLEEGLLASLAYLDTALAAVPDQADATKPDRFEPSMGCPPDSK
jgi:AcrR family transcriptional regulator